MRSDIYFFENPTGGAYEPTDFDTAGIRLNAVEAVYEAEANAMPELTIRIAPDRYGTLKEIYNGLYVRAEVPVRTVPEIENGVIADHVETYTVKTTATKAERYIYKKKNGRGKSRLVPAGETVTVTGGTEDGGYYAMVWGKYSGYMKVAALDYVGSTEIGSGADALDDITGRWIAKPQIFRIYATETDAGKDTVTLRCKPVAADLMGNLTCYINEKAVTLSDAMQGVLDGCLIAHEFTFDTNISGTHVNAIYRDKDPITCICDPDAGLCTAYGAELLLDDWRIRLLAAAGAETGVTLEYGKDLTGVTLEVDDSEIATAIRPIGEKRDGTPLYLPEEIVQCYEEWREVFMTPRIYTLNCNDCTIGKNGVTETIALARMREQAAAEFTVNERHMPRVELTVDFARLGNDPKYAMFKDLSLCYLYDTVRVRHYALGIDRTAKITGVTYDVLDGRMTEMKLGTVIRDVAQMSAWQTSNGVMFGKVKSDMVSGTSATLTAHTEPPAHMSSNSSQGCVASASSQFGDSYAAYKAFDGSSSSTNGTWASASNDTAPWIQLKMDMPLIGIHLVVVARASGTVHSPTSGRFLCSNDGETWDQMGTFSGWNGTAAGALLGSVELGNHGRAYQYVRIAIDAWGEDSTGYCTIGEITITGQEVAF